MWLPTRHVSLIAVVVVVLLLLLIGKVEGFKDKAKCRSSLSGYDATKEVYLGTEPPLDPISCEGIKVGRQKKCFEAKNGKWEAAADGKCDSWTKIVNWKDAKIKEDVAKRPWASVDGWKRAKDRNYKNEQSKGHLKQFDNTTTANCAKECKDDCKGFVFQKSNKTCWTIGSERFGEGVVKQRDMYAFYKPNDAPKGVQGGGSAPSGTTANTETNPAPVAGSSGYAVEPGNSRPGPGDFFFRYKKDGTGGKNNKTNPAQYAYIKFDSIENKGGCNNSNDNTQIKVAHDTYNKTLEQLFGAGGDPSYLTWTLSTDLDSPSNAYLITNKAMENANCKYNKKTMKSHLGSDYKQGSVTCDTPNNKVMFTNWGYWVFEKVGEGYKLRLANCSETNSNKSESAGAYLYVNSDGAKMTTKSSATVIYLQKIK